MEEIKKLVIAPFHVIEGLKVKQIYWSNGTFVEENISKIW